MNAPRAFSSRPCPTGLPAYRDEFVAYLQWIDTEAAEERPADAPNILIMCPVCLNHHEPNDAIPSLQDRDEIDRLRALM